ncbi:MAG TPA: phosphoribosylglycinamide synthetase C domain-containing protein, partial [Marmoricola sp.]|nr:phosphoribosylglycinamide synthetase C domain-containing protein [Marmoricola sp.]
TGVDAVIDAEVIHAGTALADGQLVTAGGRVLAVTAIGADLNQARDRAYQGVGAISFDGAQWRTDIAARAAAGEQL